MKKLIEKINLDLGNKFEIIFENKISYQNLNEIKNTSNIINVKSKNINDNNNEITIIYETNNQKILKILNKNFIDNKKNIFNILINGDKKRISGCINLKEDEIKKNLTNKFIRYTKYYDMSFMFSGSTSLSFLPDISKWNIKNVVNMNSMFNHCESIKNISDISKWDTKNVTNMSSMFYHCKSLTSLLDISKWNTKNVLICVVCLIIVNH